MPTNLAKPKYIYPFFNLVTVRNKVIIISILLLISFVSGCSSNSDSGSAPPNSTINPSPEAAIGSATVLRDEDGEKSVTKTAKSKTDRKTDCDEKKIEEMKKIAKTDAKYAEFQNKIAECQKKNKAPTTQNK